MATEYERGVADGAANERRRVGMILQAPEAAKNAGLAYELAFKQSIPAAEALGVLRKSLHSGPGMPTTQAEADASWAETADRVNAEAGRGSASASGADPWDAVVDQVNEENRR